MVANKHVDAFLEHYDKQIYSNAIKLREVILANLPDIIEHIDIPARMIAYCYGQNYAEMICTIIPSKNELKLGFSYGAELSDPNDLLEGTGKKSRYVVINSHKQIKSAAIKNLLISSLAAYRKRMTSIKK